MRISNIVVATDFSDLSGIAARWAQACAILFNCPITAAHVVELTVPNWFRGAYDVLEDEAMLAKAKSDLSAWFKKHANTEPDDTFIGVGNPVQELSRAVEDYESPMLIVSTSGKDAMRKFFVGSNAQALVAEVPCVTLVASPEHPLIGQGTTIAVATDLTPISDRALRFGAELCRGLESELEIVHASAAYASLSETDLKGDLGESELAEKARSAFSDFLDRHREALHGVSYKTHLIPKRAVSGISQFVQERDLDIVIIGYQDHVSMIENLFGRFAVRLLNRTTSSMIIVPGQLSKEELDAGA